MPAGSHRFHVGSIYCTVLTDGYASFPTPWFFPNADPATLARALDERRQPMETILSPHSCLLIESGRHVVLVDTGAGESSQSTGALMARLEVEGIRPRDVNTVILTHAHPDHIGGAVDSHGRPAFPNARYVISEMELEFWTAPRVLLENLRVPIQVRSALETAARSCLHALRFQLDPITGESEILPGIRVIPAPGHTPGHLALMIVSDGRKLLNIADAAAHPLHLEQPGWENGFDQDAACALNTRRDLLERSVAEDMALMAFHFPFPSVGSVAARPEGGWTWAPGW